MYVCADAGTLPTVWANLSNLEHLDLTGNTLTGEILELRVMGECHFVPEHSIVGTIPTSLTAPMTRFFVDTDCEICEFGALVWMLNGKTCKNDAPL